MRDIFTIMRYQNKFATRFGGALLLSIASLAAVAQCSICTKTAQQLGEGPASQLNTGIVYLMIMPFFLMGGLGVWWWRREKAVMASESDSQSLH